MTSPSDRVLSLKFPIHFLTQSDHRISCYGRGPDLTSPSDRVLSLKFPIHFRAQSDDPISWYWKPEWSGPMNRPSLTLRLPSDAVWTCDSTGHQTSDRIRPSHTTESDSGPGTHTDEQSKTIEAEQMDAGRATVYCFVCSQR